MRTILRRLIREATVTLGILAAVLVAGSIWPLSVGLREAEPARGGDLGVAVVFASIGLLLAGVAWLARWLLRRSETPRA